MFSEDLLNAFIAYKREAEVDAFDFAPTPIEFELYFDA